MSRLATEIDYPVVIAGGGPTGLMLAAELALSGVGVAIVERRPNQDVDGPRARGLHPRSLEVLDQRGVAERFVSAGKQHPILGYAGITLDISDFPTRHNYLLELWQMDIERILAGWALDDLGVPILREREVTGLTQDETGVTVTLSDGTSLRAAFLVGCDGGRSVVRKAAGIEFPGIDASTSWIIGEVELDEPELGMRRDGGGIGPASPGSSTGLYGVVLPEQPPRDRDSATLDDLREALGGAYGTDFGARNATWMSRFSDMARQAATYRSGRVLLAGDAADVHPPQGGQGLNVGLQDAVNLGWKLAQVLDGTSPESLLDSYHAERHPVGASVLHNTKAQVALTGPGERHQALREAMTTLLAMDEPRRTVAGMISGLDVHYELGDDDPLVGRRMPDLDLETPDGTRWVSSLLHDVRPFLLDLGGPGGFDLSPWADRVGLVHATYDGVWELPVVGEVEPPAAVLVRPDGHVAWAGDLTDAKLPLALSTWFGTGDQTEGPDDD